MAAMEAGRYLIQIQADDAGCLRVATVVAEARRDGFSWGDIAAHFRKARLGPMPYRNSVCFGETVRSNKVGTRQYLPGTMRHFVPLHWGCETNLHFLQLHLRHCSMN